MNQTSAFSRPVCGGHEALIRFPKDGGHKPILAKGGTPRVFPTEKAALQAIIRALCSHANGNMVRAGERAGALRVKAERIFCGGGEVVGVEQKRRRRA